MHYCTALTWIRYRGNDFPVLPWIAVKYLAVAVCCLIAFIAIVEWRLGIVAEQGRVASDAWQREDVQINRMNAAKVKAVRENPFWRSEGISPASTKASGKSRILVIGDSFVWGDGYVNANDIWWRQLERELHRRGYWDVEVVAAGFPGASTQDQLRWLRAGGLARLGSPDLVVLGYVTNDPDIRDATGTPMVLQIGRDIPLRQWRVLDRSIGRVTPNLAGQLRQRLTAKWQAGVRDAYPYDEWELKLLEPPNIDAYREVVGEVGAFLRRTGRPYFVVTLPNYPDRDHFGARYARVRTIFQSAGLPFHDLLDDFVREYPPGGEVLQFGIHPANGHPGTLSTRFYARRTADILEREHQSLLGPKSPPPAARRPRINDWMPPAADIRPVRDGEWDFFYPSSSDEMLEMPLGKRHVVVAFEEPVPIERLRLAGDALVAAEVFLASTDPATGIERKEQVSLGRQSGNLLAWETREVHGADRVNTIRIVANMTEERPRVTLDASSFRASGHGGYGFVVDVPQIESETDDSTDPGRSQWVLLENGRPLPHPHSLHADITEKGSGRWSHWRGGVYFSASDSSDPRSNGRRYELVKLVRESMRLRLAIDSGRNEVLP